MILSFFYRFACLDNAPFSNPGALIFELFGFIASFNDLAPTDRPSGGAPPNLFPKWQCIDMRLCLAAVSCRLIFASSLISIPTILTSTRSLGSCFIWLQFFYIFFTTLHRAKRILWYVLEASEPRYWSFPVVEAFVRLILWRPRGQCW